jgi:eukaryotic-like serine/threonine-protein kinase
MYAISSVVNDMEAAPSGLRAIQEHDGLIHPVGCVGRCPGSKQQMLEQGTLIDGRYEVEHLLGRGGMADVMRAADAVVGDAVAVKLLREHDLRSLARFRTEIEALQLLDHPSVVRLRDSGYHGTQPYLVLDLVEGPTLGVLLLGGPLGFERSLAVGEHLAAALAHAHRLDVVHRDVKPSNVLFDDESLLPRLADFGLARFPDTTRVTATGTCVGTAAYLAPEQLEGRCGPAADVFALGLLLIECLTGTLCYPGSVAEAALARLHRSPVVPADLPPWLQQTLRTMTDRQADRRPSAEAVTAAFHERSTDPLPAAVATTIGTGASESSSSAAAPAGATTQTVTSPLRPTPRRRASRSTRSRRVALAAAGLVGVISAGAAVAALTSDDLRVAEPPPQHPATTAVSMPAETTSSPVAVQVVAQAPPQQTLTPAPGSDPGRTPASVPQPPEADSDPAAANEHEGPKEPKDHNDDKGPKAPK